MIGKAFVESIDDTAFVLRPRVAFSRKGGRDIDLVVMAISHGNEYGGLPVVNAVCEHVRTGLIDPEISIGFILGNVEAALQDKRFVQKDLNRSFGLGLDEAIEDKRARQVEQLLKRARFFLDLHQTIEPSDSPFFVFNYTEKSLQFAQAISSSLPIVTHWGRPFSETKGCTAYEFMNQQEGAGLCIELGQNGFDFYPIAAGIQFCLDTIAAVKRLSKQEGHAAVNNAGNPIYTWGDIVPYPAGDVALDAGWRNFQKVERGQRVGLHNGREMLASQEGLILFPKYPKSKSEQRPPELYRLLRKTSFSELGKGDCLAPASTAA
jgi:succinylglutamate desuccinylase